MEEFVKQTLLFDFYGELLTEHQQKVYEDVVFQDMSLSEAAMEQGISRQGVHDLIRRCNRQLESYESKLKLVGRFLEIKEKASEIRTLSRQPENTCEVSEVLERIGQLSSEILEEL